MQRRLMACVLIFAILCSCVMTGCRSTRLKGLGNAVSDDEAQTLSEYQKYIANYTPAPDNAQIRIEGTAFSSCEGFIGETLKLDGIAAVATESFGSITYDCTVEHSGLYYLAIDYYPLEGYGDTIERMLYLDGALPYEEARSLFFKRQFADDGEKCYSTSGN